MLRHCLRPYRIVVSLIVLLTVTARIYAEDQARPRPEDNQLAAAEAIGQGMEVVLRAMRDEKPNGLHLTQAELSIETGTAKEGGISLNLVVFTIEHKNKKGTTDTISMTFGGKQLAEFGFVGPPPTLDEQFKNLLTKAVKAAAQISTLPLADIKVKKEFAVSKDTKGGLLFKATPPIGSVSAGGTIDWTKTSKNSIQLTYSK